MLVAVFKGSQLSCAFCKRAACLGWPGGWLLSPVLVSAVWKPPLLFVEALCRGFVHDGGKVADVESRQLRLHWAALLRGVCFACACHLSLPRLPTWAVLGWQTMSGARLGWLRHMVRLDEEDWWLQPVSSFVKWEVCCHGGLLQGIPCLCKNMRVGPFGAAS
jgi:hypothetical protein